LIFSYADRWFGSPDKVNLKEHHFSIHLFTKPYFTVTLVTNKFSAKYNLISLLKAMLKIWRFYF
ncbi:MAG TPA: hypothetical protein P5071_04030, partial [Paludibacteraceae bacterium]|nr:hypothetical protein [Paludibacteraceae bacterium]